MALPIGYPPRPDSRGRARKRHKGITYDFGKHGSADSIKQYQQFLAETLATAGEVNAVQRGTMTISTMIAAWMEHEGRERGVDHPDVQKIRRALMPLERLYGHTLAEDFRLIRLRAVREAMISGNWQTPEEKAATRKGRPTDWCASYVRKQMNRVLHVFQWAEGRDLLPEGRMHHLRELEPMPRGKVRKTKPKTAVDVELQVNPTLPFLATVYRDAVRLQLLTAARPGEIMQMRRNEIERNGPRGCWVFTPERWKNEHRGMTRHILIGPEGQAILAPYLMACPADDAPLFRSKRRGMASFTSEGYAKAVKLACADAGVKAWCPGQLRHSAKQRITREHGLDAARAIMGHTSMTMTADYDRAADIELAAQVMAKVG